MLKSVIWWTSSTLPFLLIFLVVAAYVAYLRHRSKVTQQWRQRSPISDEDFLRDCEVPSDAVAREVALAARRAAATLATVPSETILPEDSVFQDLTKLPFWDSLDWLGYALEVEKQTGYQVKVVRGIVEGALQAAGGRDALKVKHLVRSVIAAAYPPSQPAEPAPTSSTR